MKGRANLIYTARPYFDWTDQEKLDFWKTIEYHVKNQTTLFVLGNKRCFLCGAELKNPTPIDRMKALADSGHRIITNLCHDCYTTQKSFQIKYSDKNMHFQDVE